ncbi:MAG: WecB/TagA/CpsF family glycosyltransferase [Rhodothermia bacterium]|nr:WecB/TagA/CpsF family glycosyltransferase [Rhodothermia bacterium]
MSVPETADLFGIRVASLRKPELVELLVQWAGGKDRRLVSHVNVHAINLAMRNDRFRAALDRADLVFCDGHGVKWGAGKLGFEIPERLAVMDWIDELAEAMIGRELSLFLLGDVEGVAERCAALLARDHPGLRVAGTHHGFFDKSGDESARVVEKVNDSGADILMVGFGMPLQEFWIDDTFDSLDANLILPVGAAFRWYAGVERRAPKWMIHRGLEWLWRLGHHPVKMFRRYVIGNPAFAFRVFAARRRQRQPK